MSPTTSTIKEPGKQVVTVRNSDIAKFGAKLERQTPLKVYADRRGPRSGEKVVEELIHSHIKEFIRKQKGDKKMKHRKREPGSGVSSQRSNISRAMRGRIPKLPNFSAIRNQQPPLSTSEPTLTTSTHADEALVEAHHIMASRLLHQLLISCLHQNDPAERAMWKILHHLTPLSNRYSKLWKISPRSQNVSPRIGSVSPPATRNTPLLYVDTPTLVRTMTALEAEKQDSDNED